MSRRRSGPGGESGQSLVEFALVVPLLLLLLVGIIEFGHAWSMSQVINYSARQGARMAAVISGQNNGSPSSAPPVDSVERVVQRALANANIKPEDARIRVLNYVGGTDTPVTVRVEVPYRFLLFGPVMRAVDPRFRRDSFTLSSAAVMRNE